MNQTLGRAALAMLFAGAAAVSFAQSSGSLRGTVTDSTGAVVPGASVVLTDEATSFTRDTVTDATGGYYFATVSRGTYTLHIELAGFKSYEATGVQLSSNATASADITLELGEQTETILVMAERDLIQTETGAREGLITPESIERLSILGRNPTELLRTLPGVVSPDQSAFEVSASGSGFGGTGTSFSINGARPEQLGITLDGANMRDIGNNSGMMNVPNNEFVAEVKVQVGNYMAEFGTQAVNIKAVTKSGSSEFHGSTYWYNRHHTLAANDRSRSLIGQERPKSTFNYPGFTLSGPVLFPGFNQNRDKAFFFLGFELARQNVDEGSAFATVPTAGQRMGDFNLGGGQNLDQPTTVNIPGGFPGAGDPAPGNDLSPYVDPTGQALFGLYPDSNFVDPDNRWNYVFSELSKRNRNQGIARVDFNLSDSTRLYLRYARDKDASERFRGLWWNVGNVATPSPIDASAKGQSAVVNITSVLSPTTTNEVVFSWSDLRLDNMWQDPSKLHLATYGLGPGDIANPFGESVYVPEIVNQFSGARGSMWFAQDVDNIFAYNGFLRFADNFTKILNTHAIKAGVVIERQWKDQNFQHQSNIQLNFAPWANGGTGSDFGDLLTGNPASAVVGQPSAIGNFVGYNYEAYLQDAWKVSQNFTLEYGLRFGKWTNFGETQGLGAIFSPSAYDSSAGLFLDAERSQANGFQYVRTGDVDESLRGSRPLLWMPRVNFAWDIKGDGDIVARGGYGVFYVREQGNAQFDIINLPPNSYASTLDSGALQDSFGGRGLTYNTIGLADPFNNLNAFDGNGLDPFNLAWPRTTNLSFSVAKRLPWRQTVEVAYVGAWGRNLTGQLQQNILQPGTLSTGTVGEADLTNPVHRAAITDAVVDTFRPYSAYNNVRFNTNIGRTNFHSLQATLSRQSGDFQYLVAYTFGRNYGTVANDNANVDPIDPSRTEGIVRTDRRHIANLSWSWRLGAPFDSGLGKVLFNDWNMSGISTYFSGTPIRIGFSGQLSSGQAQRAWYGTTDYQGFGQGGSLGAITPTYSCDPRQSASDVGESVLNVGCIGVPEFGQSGPSSPTYDTRSPARSFHDLTVFKDFQLGGSKRLQLRFSAFNLFNQAYADPLQGDLDLQLDTVCLNNLTGVPNGAGGTSDICDPTGGYAFTDNTLANYGNIITKRGHRVVELAIRFFF